MKQQPLIVHTDWSRAWGGQEIRILTELREMRGLGFRVALVVRRDSELARRGGQDGIPVHYVDFSSKFNPAAWLALTRLIRRLRPAVINTHSSEDSWMAGCVGRLCRVPLVIKTRHVLAPISSSFSYNAFFHVVFACSEAIGRQLSEQGVRRRIIVQPTGIDENRFRFSARARAEIRQEYGIGDDEILVGNVAFLRHYKGHDFIVRTAATMPRNYRFMIVGGGDDGRAILEEEIRRAGVGDRFILTGHREDPERYFSAMDLVFFSSYETEGISQSFIQGLLYGLPLLTCRTPSVMEPLALVDHYRVVDYGDVEAAARGLRELAGTGIPDREAVERQRDRISARYGLARMVRTIVETYARYGVRLEPEQ